jgi:hypothetical protein
MTLFAVFSGISSSCGNLPHWRPYAFEPVEDRPRARYSRRPGCNQLFQHSASSPESTPLPMGSALLDEHGHISAWGCGR